MRIIASLIEPFALDLHQSNRPDGKFHSLHAGVNAVTACEQTQT